MDTGPCKAIFTSRLFLKYGFGGCKGFGGFGGLNGFGGFSGFDGSSGFGEFGF